MSNAATLERLLQPFACRPAISTADAALQPMLQQLIGAGFADLPMPGQGRTLERWRTLAAVSASDLRLAKLFEGHTDALAIMAELEPDSPAAAGNWGTWAAEPPFARLEIVDRQAGNVYLQGRKAWCSGAAVLDQALVTAWDEQQRPQLVAVTLRQPTIRLLEDGWQAVGMGSTASIDLLFEGALGRCVGLPGQYVDRPGFWQGGGGIAACWYGAACALAGYLRQHCTQPYHDAHAEAHLGAVDAALCMARAALRETARWIDDNPQSSPQLPVRRSVVTVTSPGSPPTCRYSCARAMPKRTWRSLDSRSPRNRLRAGSCDRRVGISRGESHPGSRHIVGPMAGQ